MEHDSDPELRHIIETHRRLNAEARLRTQERLERARVEAKAVAERLAESDPTVTRVVLFGSVAAGRVRNENFDIDLAVEGGTLTSLWLLAEESEFSVDLVDLDSVSPAFREMVEKRGIELFSRRGTS
jgi:predicted nucleotidyltransferase